MKAMIIGISPEYNYPGQFAKWVLDDTFYASNFGASFITRSLMKEFSADYISDFRKVESLKAEYDTVILGFATHAHAKRDIWRYVKFIEKLDMKTVVISMGVEDYLGEISQSYKFHPSVKRLLEISSASTEWIGVRGHYTASIMQQNGFRNTVPIGCPSMYSNLRPEITFRSKNIYTNPLLVYHKTFAKINSKLMKSLPLLGQDFQDEVIFTKNIDNDTHLKQQESNFYHNIPASKEIMDAILTNGKFPDNYDDWYDTISSHDFILGPRLHGCLAALTQGIPAILTPRDLRIKEIVEFFNLPNIPYNDLHDCTIEDVYDRANFDNFRDTYRDKYKNFLSFIAENKMESKLESVEDISYAYSTRDVQSISYINNIQLAAIKEKIDNYSRLRRKLLISKILSWGKNTIKIFIGKRTVYNIKKLLKKVKTN
jgi:hypothetical protein